MMDISAVRTEVCNRVNIAELAVRAGFRVMRGKSDRFHCIHSEDRNPSARLYRGRVKCDSCGGNWSPVDLEMLASGAGYIEALKALAVDTGVPWPTLSGAERERLAIANGRARDIAVDAADWARGLKLFAREYKDGLSEAMRWAWGSGADSFGDTLGLMIAAIPAAALNPDSADPKLIVNSYLRATREYPRSAASILRQGREDREHAELITKAIIYSLAASQPARTQVAA